MDKLPDNIPRLDLYRIERGRAKLCMCDVPRYSIDIVNRLVTCECGTVVDPFEALVAIAKYREMIEQHDEQRLEVRRQIDNYKPHLVIVKQLEKQIRKNMMPTCPKCGEVFDLAELINKPWWNRAYYQRTEGRNE